MKKILILVDCQKDFMNKGGALYVPDAGSIKQNILRLVADKSYDTIIATMDTHEEALYHKTDEAKIFPSHCMLKTSGHGLFDELQQALDNLKQIKLKVFQKGTFDIWNEQSFHEYVDESLSTDDELTIVGVATNYCVRFNVAGFVSKGFKNISVPSNCIKEIPDDTFNATIKEFETWGINQDVK